MARRTLSVVAGILRDSAGRVLIGERLGDTPFAGLWEFPGGKIEDGEAPLAALNRELREEIGIEVDRCSLLLTHSYSYPDRHVTIDFYLVSAWRNQPTAREGQGLRWALPGHIDRNELLPANGPVLDALLAG